MRTLLADNAHANRGNASLCSLVDKFGPQADKARPSAVVNQPPAVHKFPGLDGLSAREQQICRMIADGSTQKEIAQSLVITPNTLKVHMKRIYKKLSIHDRAGLLRKMRE